ncbi:MAG TPA: galactofuranosyltransferase, partial [Alphaproteobacteria bacterium]|nr:galactofuranosyltransferase [Alphaproteobacteria bacterium]
IWSGAALSVFVRQNHVGFTIDSLRELKHALDAVSENEYSIMQQNAARIGARLRRGAYFNDVMNQLEATCFAD